MIKLIYWTGTGNTENMAKYIAEAICIQYGKSLVG